MGTTFKQRGSFYVLRVRNTEEKTRSRAGGHRDENVEVGGDAERRRRR